ncbi:MAG: PIG-L family deacetylase [Haliscomenobacteraceae bacterium CHB4]|nr:PIG-L family deacetylase [Haliscomenobacteraceae bacterium CHB4]
MKNKFFHLLQLLSPLFLRRFNLLLLLLLPAVTFSQKPAKPNAADLHLAIKKLNVLGSALYVAAHPDDENTRMISYLRNEKLYDVSYLSMTRGDGGQNLIGPEMRELLGVLRTQELLMARSVDGGNQLFTRANDFGYSKNPDETLRFWDKEEVLADVVWAFRKVQPDLVINRFHHDIKYPNHGHHTASAMLSVEAFDLAGRADAYPEQLAYVQPWQPRREFFNTSWWFYGGQEAFAKVDKSNLYALDLGTYIPLKGKSNGEIAAESRSMHRCQGFGSMGSRGESLEWLDFVKGERPPSQDIFEGINTTWTRVEGGEPIGKLISKIDRNFRSDNPAASVPDLLSAMQMMKALPDGFWKNKKLAEIKEVIRGCLGLYLEATASEPTATPGETVKIRLEAIHRAPAQAGQTGEANGSKSAAAGSSVVLNSVSIRPALFDTVYIQNLESNKGFVTERKVKIAENADFTAPYWLQTTSTNGMYAVENQQLRGLPETPRYATVRWSFTVNGTPLEYDTDVAWKTNEPSYGEIWRPFEVLPPAFVEFTESAYLASGKNLSVTVRVKAGRESVRCKLHLAAPTGWLHSQTARQSPELDLKKKGEEALYTFELEPKPGADASSLLASVEVDGKMYSYRLVTVKYDHIPQQSVLRPAVAPAALVDLQVKAKKVGYYMGAGDDIPAALRQMGCIVDLLEDKDLEAENLKKYDAIVLGIRAYDTKEGLMFRQKHLFDYVQNGGTLVTQYNNELDLRLDDHKLAPYPLKISRTRVTDETADVRFLLPEHPALNTPNKLTSNDFSGWLQERGLYFPSKWDAAFEAPISMNDPGETAADGSLLVARHGKGWFVYTGLSFFRELPAGVPGAYRLFANLISLGR